MKKIDYALENTDFGKDFILIYLCPNRFNLKDKEDCESTYQVENNPCKKCWNEEIEEGNNESMDKQQS